MLQEFKDFINKGNVLEIAVGLLMALAFAPIVTAFVDDILMQFVAAIFGQPEFGQIGFDLGDARVEIGNFINAIISFVIIAFALFLVVQAYNAMTGGPDDAGPDEVELLTEIRDALRARS